MKKLFEIGIGYNPRTGQYVAVVNSLTDNQHCALAGENMRILMTKVAKRVRKKHLDIKLFPMPETKRANGSGTRLLESARN